MFDPAYSEPIFQSLYESESEGASLWMLTITFMNRNVAFQNKHLNFINVHVIK
jgi:hypothetical protein